MTAPRRLVAILGPTGVGKTATAARVARAVGGEVVVADSRQVYRRLEIATNKPLPEERELARFHMIDLVDPEQVFNVHQFVLAATAVLEDIWSRGRLPVLEGGTVLYVRALLQGFELGAVPPDEGLRTSLESLSLDELGARVRALDPDAALDFRNRVRVVRALETLVALGPPLARARGRKPPQWDVLKVGIRAPLEVIDRRLEARSARQVERGLVAETRAAIESGVPESAPVLTGTGYVEAVANLRGVLADSDLVTRMSISNRQLARRQLRLLRAEPAIIWFEAEPDPVPGILSSIEQWLTPKTPP